MSHQPTTNEVIDLTEDSSSDDEPTAQLDETVRAQLLLAIKSTPEASLRQVIEKLVTSDPNIEQAFLKELVTIRKKSRKAISRWEVCENCEDEFDVSTRRWDDECWYHDGDAEEDEDAWPDHEEKTHGPIDTPENRRANPEGFIWNCCEKTLEEEGCVHGKHVARQQKLRFH